MFQSLKKNLAPVAALTVAGISSAHATIGEDITGAFTAGEANLGLAAAGVISMVAVVTGIGFIVSMLRK